MSLSNNGGLKILTKPSRLLYTFGPGFRIAPKILKPEKETPNQNQAGPLLNPGFWASHECQLRIQTPQNRGAPGHSGG